RAEHDLRPRVDEDPDAALPDPLARAGDEDDLVLVGHDGRDWPSSRWSRRRSSGTSRSSMLLSLSRSSRVRLGNDTMPTFSSAWRTLGWTLVQSACRSSTLSFTRSSRA